MRSNALRLGSRDRCRSSVEEVTRPLGQHILRGWELKQFDVFSYSTAAPSV
ncbi:MAG: hypothetical protein J0I99_16490 [Devosia sp.]|uniref:hypothetical protein n=1 Tax=Devosia sp. TaxID=1871048 RepID=UPI001AC58EB6|nr:hypothetical protein [Devosia sp.]MBN9310534.1 hypothetical protein [Devosia sp.]MBN9317343.1 hypothetical protein [Devosia sp.]